MKVCTFAALVYLLQGCRQQAPSAPAAEPVITSSADAAGADVQLDDFCEDQHPSELHLACSLPDKRLVEKILNAGTPVDERDACGRTPVMSTFVMSVPEVSLSMRPSKAETGRVNRQLASENAARMEVAWLLLDRGADGKAVDRDSNSVLLAAAGFGGGGPRLVEIVKRLVRQGADIQHPNSHGKTPLMASAWSGRIDVARILLDNGANAAARDKTGRSALDIARSAGRAEMISLLQKTSQN